ncbi:MAG: right-handed parallel beta-helix repeat-containing protein [Caulobacteraceae bacterium]|nr:right-handed parallel beta-helix repeat-containing protein [Caulobacteraceae bacterium]
MAEPQTFNVKDFGAKGDGSTLDTAAIQAALDAAYAAGGGVVYIPAGVYLVHSRTGDASDGALQIRDNVTLAGEGMGVSVLKVRDGEDNKITGVVRTPAGEVTHDVVIRDLTIDGNHQKNSGDIDGFFCGVEPGSPEYDYNILVERVEIMNVSRYAFDPHEQTKNLTIRDSVAHHNLGDGFTIDFCSDVILENNVAYANGRYGFNIVTSSHDVLLKNNVAYDNALHGIAIQKGSEDRPFIYDVKIEGGAVYDNGRYGIEIKLSEKVTVEGVEIYGNASGGVSIFGAQDNLITGNWIHDNGGAGVRIHEYDDREGTQGTDKLWAASGNTVTDNRIDGHAIAVMEESDSSFGNASYFNLSTGSTVGIGLLPLSDSSGSTNTVYVGYLGGTVSPPLDPALGLYFENILRTDDTPGALQIAQQLADGDISISMALALTVELADGTTSVATMSYEFFTGRTPTAAGLDFLVDPEGPNGNNLNSDYYQFFNTENRFINFAVNLGRVGEGQAGFNETYGALTFASAAKAAYAEIFGGVPTDEKINEILGAPVQIGGQSATRADYFYAYGGDDLGAKAAMVGWLLAEAAKANLGMYAQSNSAYLTDLADGGPYNVDLIGVYGSEDFAFPT